jgi:hypothetical protein
MSRPAELVAAIDRELDAFHVHRLQETGLSVRDVDELVELHRQTTRLALLTGFPAPPELAQAQLVSYNPFDMSAKPYPNRDAGQEWESALRSLRAKAEAAAAAAAPAPHATEQVATLPKPKRGTVRGDARTKIIAALSKHHQYAEGGCLNTAPAKVRELAQLAGVSPDSVSEFFKKEFGKEEGYIKYQAACRDASILGAWLKLLNKDYSPHPLFGGTPPGEGRDTED